MFRKLYYDNGSHAGCIIYIGAAQVNRESMDSLKETLQGARGGGAFKNVLIHAPNGGKEGVQILPFQQITAKDEFMNVKAASRDDVLAAHRVPPQKLIISSLTAPRKWFNSGNKDSPITGLFFHQEVHKS